ncbi:MAG: hypothetical protein CVV03_09795 [Firmicutes bacterium HGW-Firmicutes-8]|nr:MAG: hypothetical protein CVV03_09795 [Firmicutes bacterium HGW-Firmicutes-8]
MKLLAHSAQPKKGLPEQTYQEHVIGVFRRAQTNVKEMLKYGPAALQKSFLNVVLWSACFHDLGKLDEENQEVLCGKRKANHLPINHVDAGVAYLKEIEKKTEAAFILDSRLNITRR